MINLIYFILCSAGLTQIIIYGKIFDKIRPKYYLFQCSMCMGFWAGIIVWLLSPYTSLFSYDNKITTGFFLGCISSLTSYILLNLFDDEGIKIANKWRK